MSNEFRNRILAEEGEHFPSNSYRKIVLQPAYDEAKQHFLTAIMHIHIAHLKMLEEQNLISTHDAKIIAHAIRTFDMNAYRTKAYNPKFEDLFFRIEHKLIQMAGDVAGNLHIGRSRNDMGIAIYRMTIRHKLLFVMTELHNLRNSLIEIANDHTDTIMIGYTHTQQAQPTTFAHYLKAVIDQLTRDFDRLKHAFETVNRSSMGAAALTTTGFVINRERMQQLLAFDDLIENAWDAVASADYIAETASMIKLAAIHLGRTSQDFLLWVTTEFNSLHLANPYIQISSIMPQKRNPVSLEHTRSLLSSVVGDADTVLQMIHNTPFGDIVDTEDDMQPYIWRAIDKLAGVYKLFGSVVVTMQINKEQLLKRAQNSFATVTELADTLVRIEGYSFRQAHTIVSRSVQQVFERGEDTIHSLTYEEVNKQTIDIVGRPLTLSAEQFYATLQPEHFIEVRTLIGGPSPETMRQSLVLATNVSNQMHIWLTNKKLTILQAEQQLEQFLKDWDEHV